MVLLRKNVSVNEVRFIPYSKGYRIPATRIVDFPDNFERAVLAEGHESMGEKWTHYGYRGTYGSFGTNGLYRENPWANNPNKNYVVPFYFDQNHSIDDQTKKDSGSTSFLNFFLMNV